MFPAIVDRLRVNQWDLALIDVLGFLSQRVLLQCIRSLTLATGGSAPENAAVELAVGEAAAGVTGDSLSTSAEC